uniref:Uncharacterized protein n=1 Tax=Sphaerodactylus townsendi TaxID=933632 RepID=A0ACB8FVG8_9SAUR
MVTVRNPAPRDLNKEGISPPANYNPKEGYHVDFGDPQEILDSPDNSEEYFPMEGLSPLLSLREDELLVAIEASTTKRNHIKLKKGYRLVRQQSKRQEEKKQVQDPEFVLQSLPLPVEEQADAGEQLLMAGLEVHGFNEALSQQIPLYRELPEVRHHLCLQQESSPNLPTASVIIYFHNEAWSTLLRTVHSILATSPRALLREIILVDDLSTQGYLKTSLSEHISKLAGVKLIRSNKRLGVVRGRMLGAARATGDVVVFMDSHCECLKGWLEPLLDRLASDRSQIVSPVIDVIDWKTFQFYHSMDLQRGIFDWKLDFHWKPLPEHEEKARLSPISPIRSPTISEVVVAMDRHYFQNTGGYDPDMTLSGVENIELSIKTWLCGGSVEILPCSHVGHVYRARIPYQLQEEDAVVKNKIRIAETWLDSFKDLFYEQNRNAFLISEAGKPNCSERFQLQKRLGCKGFQWIRMPSTQVFHLSRTITKQHAPLPYSLYNTGAGFCVEYKTQQDAAGGHLELSPCNDNINQHFEYSSMKKICFSHSQQLCFDVRHKEVVLQNCTKAMENSSQLWDIEENGMIVHILSGKCIEALKTDLCLQKCNKKANLIWQFEHSFHPDER